MAGRTDPWSRWAEAVAVMASGSYREAFATFAPLAANTDAELAGLAAAASASGLRQIDEHAAAVPHDERACARPGQGRCDGWIGRAADEVGLGRPAEAVQCLERAATTAQGWRDRVRLGWVQTEIALLQGEWAHAEEYAEAALAQAAAAQSPRHVVKSQLILAVVRRRTRPEAGLALLRDVVATGAAMRLRPLVWPAVLVLGADATAAERLAGAAAVRHVSAHLPPDRGMRWRERADVASLLEAAAGN